MAVTTQRKASTGDMVKMFLTIGIPIAIMFIPTNAMFTAQIRVYLAVTMVAILAFAFENLNQTLIALALPFAYTLMNIAPATVVYSPWSTNVVWMTLGGVMLADMATKSGLLKRIAYKAIILTGGSYKGIIWGLGLSGIMVTILLSGNGIIPMVAVAYGFCTALELGKSKESAGIMLAAAFGCILSSTFFFNPGPVMYAGFAAMEMTLSWIQYFTKQAVGIVYFFAVLFILERMCRPAQGINGKEYFIEQYEKLGKTTMIEIKAAAICLLLLVFLLTGSIHKIPVIWGFGFIPLLAFVPGINICDSEDMVKTNFGIAFFVAACMAIGTVGASLGIGQIVSEVATPLLAGKSASFVFFFVYILFVVLNFVMTPIAIAAAFTAPFVAIVSSMGINPEAYILFQVITLDQVFLPYEYVMYLVVFSFGVIHIKDFVKIMTMKFLCCTVYLFLLLIPYWKMIGFLHLG